MCAYDDALAMAKDIFKNSDPAVISDNSGCYFDEENKLFKVIYCKEEYLVSYPDGLIKKVAPGSFTGEEEVVILQYLNWSRGLASRRQWISFLELPGGEMHFTPFQKEAVFPLARKFKRNIDEFVELSSKAGESMEAGDAAFVISVFPRIEIAVILWEEDEEYPARANVLFDITASSNMPTASLYVLGIQAVRRIYELYA